MSKKFLGIISLLYALIFSYVVLFDKIKFFLAPQIQIYIKLSIIPLFLLGIILILKEEEDYEFKISDLILVLPLVMLILAGDGRLNSHFAKTRNRRPSISAPSKETSKTEDDDYILKENYDFKNPYFYVSNKSYGEIADYLSFGPGKDRFIGKTIKVSGFALKKASYIPDNYFALGKYLITCCAADADFIGFFVKRDKYKIKSDAWYDIEGVLLKGKDRENHDILYIKIVNLKEINGKKELTYVYPCYSSGDNECYATKKYKLDY